MGKVFFLGSVGEIERCKKPKKEGTLGVAFPTPRHFPPHIQHRFCVSQVTEAKKKLGKKGVRHVRTLMYLFSLGLVLVWCVCIVLGVFFLFKEMQKRAATERRETRKKALDDNLRVSQFERILDPIVHHQHTSVDCFYFVVYVLVACIFLLCVLKFFYLAFVARCGVFGRYLAVVSFVFYLDTLFFPPTFSHSLFVFSFLFVCLRVTHFVLQQTLSFFFFIIIIVDFVCRQFTRCLLRCAKKKSFSPAHFERKFFRKRNVKTIWSVKLWSKVSTRC